MLLVNDYYTLFNYKKLFASFKNHTLLFIFIFLNKFKYTVHITKSSLRQNIRKFLNHLAQRIFSPSSVFDFIHRHQSMTKNYDFTVARILKD